MSTLRIALLGMFALALDETPVTTVNLGRLQSLLTYLLLHNDAPQSRAHIAFLLWPDSLEAQAHSNLRKLLHQLRQVLPNAEAFVQADRHNLQWLPTADVSWRLDVLEFEQALRRAELAREDPAALRLALEQAAKLYGGDLLPACYDEWILPERDRLRQAFLQALERWLLLLEQERDYEAAIGAAQQLLRHDPLQEETYRQLMRLYALSGKRAAALRVYHTCATVLERELATGPNEATRAAYEALMRQDTEVHVPNAPGLPRGPERAELVGRKAEWNQLQTLWRSASSRRPQVVFVTGEAGIGKTRLAEELLTWVGRQGLIGARARCYAAEGRLPYGPVTAWLRTEGLQAGVQALPDPWLAEVARLLPDLLTGRSGVTAPTAIMEGWQRQQFFEALKRAFLSARPPLLLLLDDLQWCDRETLEWLHFLLRSTTDAPLLLLGTVRTEELSSEQPLETFRSAVERLGLLTEIALGPLDEAETTHLAERVVGRQLEGEAAQTLHAETEGNPLFVVELLRSGGLNASSESSSTLPVVVQRVLSERLAQLSTSARELVGLAAVIGREFAFPVLMWASGVEEEQLVHDLDELWQRRIVREQADETYDFSHAKLREAAYQGLSAPRRRLLHRRVAEALAGLAGSELDAVSSQLAAHYERAGLRSQAIAAYQRAAEVACSIYANAEAVAALRQALTLLERAPALPPVKARVYEQLGEAQEALGQHLEARQAYLQACEQNLASDLLVQARLQRKIAQTWRHPPQPLQALRAYQEAEEQLARVAPAEQGEADWQREWLQTQVEQLQPLFILGRAEEMTRVIERAQSLLERSENRSLRALFYRHVALRDAVRDHYRVSEETLSCCRLALELSRESGQQPLIGLNLFGLGYCLLLAGELDEAEVQLQAAQALSERIEDGELALRSTAFLSVVYRLRGQEELVRGFVQADARYSSLVFGQRAWLAWRANDLAAVEAHGREALEDWQRQRYVFTLQWLGRWPLVALALARGRGAEAFEHVAALLSETQQPPPEALSIQLAAALQAWEGGERDAAQEHLRAALPLARELHYL